MTHFKDILVWMLMMFCYFDYNIVTEHNHHGTTNDEINLVVVWAMMPVSPLPMPCATVVDTKTQYPHS